ncbi:hypothetical protein DSL92_01075 [Billgrantia gudaonensis]|uniref:Uncharacterized protein n=1 Tax=Billgrantia gudaonensis TaxID=376427 RepID=A0A3S0QGC1_9GAMM|nr:hypothetical protein DSL92_01075 [Halomonas gudaonensis]
MISAQLGTSPGGYGSLGPPTTRPASLLLGAVPFDAALPAITRCGGRITTATLNDYCLRFVARNDHKPGRERQG